ncbi:MAG: DUF2254 domain-containing protein [Flavisolibacter sp.]
MEIRLKQYWFNIRNSLWFLPAIMGLAAVVLALVLIEVDNNIDYDKIPIEWFVYGGNPQGARSVLSTIASSMVTIAGVTFSITLVALTMASSEFGPRLLRNFIADKGNQFVIGTFIATFIYSLVVLLTIRGTDNDEFIPKISVIFGFLLAVLSLGVIIYFIHHVSTSIQADFVIKSSFSEFQKVTDEVMDREPAENVEHPDKTLQEVENTYALHRDIAFVSSGYIQSIDFKGISHWATENRAMVHLLVHPGSFATLHQVFARVYSHDALDEHCDESIRKLIVTGYQRTPNQDILFSIKQIVEVGIRSLSPGINDPHTAITCLHWLGATLMEIASRSFRPPLLRDDAGICRLIYPRITYEQIVDTCFDQIKLYGKSNPYVIQTLLQEIEITLRGVQQKEFREALRNKAEMIQEEMHRTWENNADLKTIDNVYRNIMAVFVQP